MSDISRRSFLSAAAASGSLPAVSAAKASQKFDLTTDVLIAGGGAAGCMAAVEAAKKVLLVQRRAPCWGGAAPRFPRAGSVLQTPSGTKSAALRPGLPNNVALKPSDLHLFLEFLQKFVAFPSFLFIIGCNGCTQ